MWKVGVHTAGTVESKLVGRKKIQTRFLMDADGYSKWTLAEGVIHVSFKGNKHLEKRMQAFPCKQLDLFV